MFIETDYNSNINENLNLLESKIEECYSRTLARQSLYNNSIFLESVSKDNNDKKIDERISETSKKTGIPESALKRLVTKHSSKIRLGRNFVRDTLNSTKSFLEDTIKEFRNMNTINFTKATMLLLAIFFVNVGTSLALMTLFGPIVGTIMGFGIVDPLVEEICKNISIKGDYGSEFLLLFNTAEFLLYVKTHAAKIGLKKIIVRRSFTAAMHKLTMEIQRKLMDKGIDKDKDGKKASTIAITLATIVHSAWNLGGANMTMKLATMGKMK